MPAISNPHHTHLLGYANFTIKPIVECFLLFSHTHFTPSVYFYASRCRKFLSLASPLHHVIAKNTIFSSQSINHYNTWFACHVRLTKIITFFRRVRIIIASWYYIFAPICRTEVHHSQIFIMNIIIFRS